MKCPYCGADMVPGYLQSSRMLVWDREKLSDVILPSSDGGRCLTKRLARTHAIRSYLCENCDILLSAPKE